MRTTQLPAKPTHLAPDGSEIRELLSLKGGGLAHCTLSAKGVTRAVQHRTVEELWYVLAGRGQVWRRDAAGEETVDLSPGMSLDVPTGVHFQFRTVGDEPLVLLIATMPPWPGASEAVRVRDHWPVD